MTPAPREVPVRASDQPPVPPAGLPSPPRSSGAALPAPLVAAGTSPDTDRRRGTVTTTSGRGHTGARRRRRSRLRTERGRRRYRGDLRRFGTGRRGRSPRRRRGRRRRNGLRISRHLDVEAVEDPADTINGLQGHPAAGPGLSTSAGTGRRIGRHREVEARLTGGRAGTVHSQVDVLTEELLVPGHGAHAAGPENLLGGVGVGQGVHRHCHGAGRPGLGTALIPT